MYSVLIGLQKKYDDTFRSGLIELLGYIIDWDEIEVEIYDNQKIFYDQITKQEKHYRLIITIDDQIEYVMPYTEFLMDKPAAKGITVVILMPEQAATKEYVENLIDRGLYNILYMEDCNKQELESRIYYPFNKDQAERYCKGLVLKEMTSVNGETRTIVKGLSATRLLASQFKSIMEEKTKDTFFEDFLEENIYSKEAIEMPVYEFPLENPKIRQQKKRLITYFQKKGVKLYQTFEHGSENSDAIKKEAENVLRSDIISEDLIEETIDSFIRDITSYGILDNVINDRSISDIRLLNKDTITVQARGKWYKTNLSFSSDSEYARYISKICTKNHAAVNIRDALAYFSDMDTNPNYRLRFMVTHNILNASKYDTAHIRKIDKIKKSISELLDEGLMTKQQAAFLINCMKHRKSIIICGPSGSGKTVLLNFLIEYAPNEICGACIQESDELFSDTKVNIEFQHSLNAKGENKAVYDLHTVTKSSVLKNAELLIIGEIKGEEARQFYSAANMGTQVITTTHSDACVEALPRIADLARYGGDFTTEDLLKQLSNHIDIVIFMKNYSVQQIAGVVGWDQTYKDIVYDLYEFGQE